MDKTPRSFDSHQSIRLLESLERELGIEACVPNYLLVLDVLNSYESLSFFLRTAHGAVAHQPDLLERRGVSCPVVPPWCEGRTVRVGAHNVRYVPNKRLSAVEV